jgi:formamidopyrimidine-DNA glycosylase
MPELPEVETIRRALGGSPDPILIGGGSAGVGILRERAEGLSTAEKIRQPVIERRIQGAHLYWERTLAEPAPEDFSVRVEGQVIRQVGRRGKFLLLELDRDTLIFHLRMSGDLLVEMQDSPIAPHHRLTLELDKDLRLAFNDPRKFGRAWLVADPGRILAGLGPEPFDPTFAPGELYARLRAHRRQLKPLLLDQTFLAGLGNIYADEALHLARLHPLTLASDLDEDQASRLWSAIRKVLEESIDRQGASIDWVYRGGEFQNYFRVYQRTGEPCQNCGTPIERIVVGQRGTHFCPECQRRTKEI